jgi:hypothetical protein
VSLKEAYNNQDYLGRKKSLAMDLPQYSDCNANPYAASALGTIGTLGTKGTLGTLATIGTLGTIDNRDIRTFVNEPGKN